MTDRLNDILQKRFGRSFAAPDELGGNEALVAMAARGSCRAFKTEAVPRDVVETLCAIALSAPTKSDLQQRDIIVVSDPELRRAIDALVAGQGWIAAAPNLLVFCGNNRRQRQIHRWRGRDFANDHLDAFFNSAVDAAIALAAFVAAAEAAGLGCCPISTIRNRADAVSELLGLPNHVFPIAGLALGYPAAEPPTISMRLPLAATVHHDKFDETSIEEQVTDYDRRRHARQPLTRQRHEDLYGTSGAYGWSEDKARQYSRPERRDFGQFVRNKGFRLD